MRYFTKDVLPLLLTLVGIAFLLTLVGPQHMKPIVEALLP